MHYLKDMTDWNGRLANIARIWTKIYSPTSPWQLCTMFWLINRISQLQTSYWKAQEVSQSQPAPGTGRKADAQHKTTHMMKTKSKQTSSFISSQAINLLNSLNKNEPPHDKTNKMNIRSAKTQISLGIRPVWSESSLCAQWVATCKGPSILHADSEASDRLGGCPGWSESSLAAQSFCRFCHEAAQMTTKL